MLRTLTLDALKIEAANFAAAESAQEESALFGITDGKAVGTYLEQKFQRSLKDKYDYVLGSSAEGFDFPELGVDVKSTSVRLPQSSCPFRSARQKIYGLGYHLLIFVYDRCDDHDTKTCRLNIRHSIFVDKAQTADYQTTTGLLKILENHGNLDDVLGFFSERSLPLDDVQAQALAEEIFEHPPQIGYLGITNALQWRLRYSRVIQEAGNTPGIERL